MNREDFFQSLDLDRVRTLVETKQEETLHLDFITLDSAGMTNPADKRNFARIVSAFANSDGGVVVWGVDARRNAEGVDCACGLKEIADLARLMSRLNTLTGEAVTPRVDNVVHKPVRSVGDTGFAATLVPASDSGPHMAKLGEDRYFKRSGSSLYRMEHFDLEDMFGRRMRPRLTLEVELINRTQRAMPNGITSYRLLVLFGILNDGRGIAKSPYLTIRKTPRLKGYDFGIDGNGGLGLPKLSSSNPDVVRYGGNSTHVIHPGVRHDVDALEWSIDVGVGKQPRPQDLLVEYELGAEEIALVRGTRRIEAAALARIL
jgi:hypothetical protein